MRSKSKASVADNAWCIQNDSPTTEVYRIACLIGSLMGRTFERTEQ